MYYFGLHPVQFTIIQKIFQLQFLVCEGKNCNANNEIEDEFSSGEVLEGFPVPMYCQEYDSALDSNFDPENPGWGRGVRCPLYADYGCFAGNYTADDGSMGFYRGCSTFSDPTGELMGWGPGPVCNEWDDGDETCKQKCDTHYCNRDKIRNPTQCFVCQEQGCIQPKTFSGLVLFLVK